MVLGTSARDSPLSVRPVWEAGNGEVAPDHGLTNEQRQATIMLCISSDLSLALAAAGVTYQRCIWLGFDRVMKHSTEFTDELGTPCASERTLTSIGFL